MPFFMRLSELLNGIISIESSLDCEITGLCQDSRQVKPGDLFFAYPGTQVDGRNFIEDALKKGAVAVLIEEKSLPPLRGKDRMGGNKLVFISNLAYYLGPIASRFYGEPSKHLKVVGVTGTNGKTSCSQFIAACLQTDKYPTGVIGTIGYGLYGHLQQGPLTTPDALDLQKLFVEFRQQEAKYVAMEVSSHRLAQKRLNGTTFDVAVFTNLTRDHLDYHGDMQSYAQAKRSLFDLPVQNAVLNADDLHGAKWLHELHGKLPIYAYSLEQPKPQLSHIPYIYVGQTRFDTVGMTASVYTPWGDGVLHNPNLVGPFNLSNLLAVLSVLGITGMSLQQALDRIAQLKGVHGRMETFGGGERPLVVVDYSHTPDALEQALKALRIHCQGKLWCVFGCGGDRDRGKRPLMGKVATEFADQVIITDDNPRREDPKQIVSDIMQGLLDPINAVIEHDRRRAIAHAISCAQAGDAVLIAGKGHETYQIIGDEKFPFSDSMEVKLLLAE